MAIPCPECQREYDVTLFEYGRTIDCTCGARVIAEKRERALPAGEPRFLVDAMLGNLARWLRTLGYDTRFEPDAPDAELVRIAFEEERVLITRDAGLVDTWRFTGCLLVDDEGPESQLETLDERYRIGRDWRDRLFTRCLNCNAELRPADAEDRAEADNEVPEDVIDAGTDIVYCPSCTQLFWEGSHTRRMRAFLEPVFEEDDVTQEDGAPSGGDGDTADAPDAPTDDDGAAGAGAPADAGGG